MKIRLGYGSTAQGKGTGGEIQRLNRINFNLDV